MLLSAREVGRQPRRFSIGGRPPTAAEGRGERRDVGGGRGGVRTVRKTRHPDYGENDATGEGGCGGRWATERDVLSG